MGEENIRLLQISTHDMTIKEYEQRLALFLVDSNILSNEASEARAANVVPNLKVGLNKTADDGGTTESASCHLSVDAEIIRRRELTVVAVVRCVVAVVAVVIVVINTRSQCRTVRRPVPLTQKHGAQRLAEEPLTFPPDTECCPPSAALVIRGG